MKTRRVGRKKRKANATHMTIFAKPERSSGPNTSDGKKRRSVSHRPLPHLSVRVIGELFPSEERRKSFTRFVAKAIAAQILRER